MLVVTMKQMTMTMMLARARFPECLFMKFHVVQYRGRSLRPPGAYTERFSQYPPTAPRPAKTFREVLLISWARGRLQVRASKPLTSVLGICAFALRFATLFVAAGLGIVFSNICSADVDEFLLQVSFGGLLCFILDGFDNEFFF